MTPAGTLKWAHVLPTERTALVLGFAFHFCVLASYYLVRPLRDALGLEGGADKLQWLFTATFVVMLRWFRCSARWCHGCRRRGLSR